EGDCGKPVDLDGGEILQAAGARQTTTRDAVGEERANRRRHVDRVLFDRVPFEKPAVLAGLQLAPELVDHVSSVPCHFRPATALPGDAPSRDGVAGNGSGPGFSADRAWACWDSVRRIGPRLSRMRTGGLAAAVRTCYLSLPLGRL